MNTLLDQPVDTGVRSACAACGQRTRGRGDLLCGTCWTKAPTLLVSAYRVAWNAVQFEGLGEGRLTSAIENLIAGVRGEPPPNAEPPPPSSYAPPPTPTVPPRTILPPPEDRAAAMPATKKVRSKCHVCLMEFEYTPKDPKHVGRRRTTCDKHKDPPAQAAKPTTKRDAPAPRRAPARATDLARTSFDYAELRAQLRDELEAITTRASQIQNVLDALEALDSGEAAA